MADLLLRNVRKTYESINSSRVVLDGIDLNVSSGDFVAVLGPSGCGKTTLLKVIAGLVSPDVGDFDLRVNGRPITGPGPDRTIVFQQHNSFPSRTVFENVRFGVEFIGLSRTEQNARAEKYLELVGLSEYRNEYPKVLSGGQSQRVAIARTLAGGPEVILMDEPFAALDAQTREGMQAELLRIQNETGSTIVFVTHDIAEAAFLGNQVYVLSRIPAKILTCVDAFKTRNLILSGIGSRRASATLNDSTTEREQVRYEPRFLEIQRDLREALMSSYT